MAVDARNRQSDFAPGERRAVQDAGAGAFTVEYMLRGKLRSTKTLRRIVHDAQDAVIAVGA